MNKALNEMSLNELRALILVGEVNGMKEANEMEAKFEARGLGDCCGFGWVELRGIKGNTKLGKKLKELGVKQNHHRNFYFWSKYPGQGMTCNEAWADGFAKVWEAHGFDCFRMSRMD